MARPPPIPPLAPTPPPLIKLGMWGLSSRKMTLACLWSCVVLSALCALLALITPWALIGVAYFLACVWWYLAAIRWVDRNNGRWPGFYSLSH